MFRYELLEYLKNWLSQMAVAKENNEFLTTVNLNNIFPLLALGKAAHDIRPHIRYFNGTYEGCYCCHAQLRLSGDFQHEEGCPADAIDMIIEELMERDKIKADRDV